METMEKILPRVNQCLCCIPLKIGALIVGYASIAISLSFISAMVWSLYKVASFVHSHQNVPVGDHSPEEVAQLTLGLYLAHVYFIIVMALNLIISGILIMGLYENKPIYIRYYVQFGKILLVLAFILMVVSSIFFGLLISLPILIWIGILFYSLIAVRSTYLDIIEETERKDYEMQNITQQQALVRNE